MNVRLSKEQKIQILNSADVYNIMQQILLRENKIRRGQEHFWVVGLDTENKVLFIELIGLGRQNRVEANPPDIFRMGIYKLAVKMILVHNHPSGTEKASQADLDLTDRLIKVGKLINIDVVDHLIITEEKYVSMADEGVMDQLRNSGLFEIVKRDQDEIKDWKLKMERERAETAKAEQIAKSMKEKGFDDDTIKELTGLYKHQIERL